MHKLAVREASRNSLAYYPQVNVIVFIHVLLLQIIESLVQLLQTTQDINTQTEAAMALRELCCARPAAAAVRSVLSVPDLVQLLRWLIFPPSALFKIPPLLLHVL